MSKPSKKGFTLVELMVVVSIIGVLLAALVPQVGNAVYKAKVSATALTLKNFKMGIDMLINDLGYKPTHYGEASPTTDQLALMKRTSCPAYLKSFWAGPYVQNYPTQKVSSLFAYPDSFWYYYSWPGGVEGDTWFDWCGAGAGILLHTSFISDQARRDVEAALLGKINPGSSWLVYCGFHDGKQVAPW